MDGANTHVQLWPVCFPPVNTGVLATQTGGIFNNRRRLLFTHRRRVASLDLTPRRLLALPLFSRDLSENGIRAVPRRAFRGATELKNL